MLSGLIIRIWLVIALRCRSDVVFGIQLTICLKKTKIKVTVQLNFRLRKIVH